MIVLTSNDDSTYMQRRKNLRGTTIVLTRYKDDSIQNVGQCLTF